MGSEKFSIVYLPKYALHVELQRSLSSRCFDFSAKNLQNWERHEEFAVKESIKNRYDAYLEVMNEL